LQQVVERVNGAANDISITRAYLSKLEKGGTDKPNVFQLAAIARALETPLEQLVHGRDAGEITPARASQGVQAVVGIATVTLPGTAQMEEFERMQLIRRLETVCVEFLERTVGGQQGDEPDVGGAITSQ
jgi:transcriptional regulator with XRE-family HTH domain